MCTSVLKRHHAKGTTLFISWMRKGKVWRGEGIAHTPKSNKRQGGPSPALPESKGHVLSDHVTASQLRGWLGIHYLVLWGEERLTARVI